MQQNLLFAVSDIPDVLSHWGDTMSKSKQVCSKFDLFSILDHLLYPSLNLLSSVQVLKKLRVLSHWVELLAKLNQVPWLLLSYVV